MSFPAYPTYKDSGVEWLGQVPEHWEYIPIWLLFDVGRGRVISNEEIIDNQGPYPVYSSQTEHDGCMGNIATFDFDGDYLTWTTDGANAGTVFRRSGKFNCTNVCGTLKARTEKVVLDYCLHAVGISTAFFVRHDINPKLMNNVMAKIRIPIPPLPEQHAIASFLDRETSKIDALVAEQRKLIELLKEKRQAVISHAVTKGLNPDAPMKDSGIEWLGMVPEHWEVGRVKTITSFVTSGPRGWSERVADEGPLFVQSGDLNETLQIKFENSKRVKVGYDAETTRTQLFDGDVVICVTGAKTGNVAVCSGVPETSFVNQHLCLVRPNECILPMFLGILLKSDLGQTYFDLSQYGLKQVLSLENVKQTPILVPPVDEQLLIVEQIGFETEKFDSLEKAACHAIDLLQERRTALISTAVTGKIDVREVVDTSVRSPLMMETAR
jgi:type I restriction enzyme S subunit